MHTETVYYDLRGPGEGEKVHVGLEDGEGKPAGVGRGKQKMIMRTCDKINSLFTLSNSTSVHLWIHTWAIQINSS